MARRRFTRDQVTAPDVVAGAAAAVVAVGLDGTQVVPAPPAALPGELDHIPPDLRSLAVPVESLVPDPRNARLHDERNLAATTASLRAHGQRKPIVVRAGSRVVVAGNGTLTCAKALGWRWIAASIQAMDDRTAAAYAIADNRTAELATWDPETLNAILREVATGPGITLDSLGFTDAELSALVAGVTGDGAAPAEGGQDVGDVQEGALPELADGDRDPFQQRKFTVHDTQAAIVDQAIEVAVGEGLAASDLNDNRNGNALAGICRAFLASRGKAP